MSLNPQKKIPRLPLGSGWKVRLKAMALQSNVPELSAMAAFCRERTTDCFRTLCLWCPAHARLETGEMDGFLAYFCEVAQARVQERE